MHLLHTEESNDKLNPCSTCLCYGPPPPLPIVRAQISQIILGSPAQSGDPRFAQQNLWMVQIRTCIYNIYTCTLTTSTTMWCTVIKNIIGVAPNAAHYCY